MFFSAQRPNAAEPPDLLINATIIPSKTRNKKIPAVSEIAEIRPSLMMVSIVFAKNGLIPEGLVGKPTTNMAPIKTPAKSEEYASLVMRAKTMATSGGTKAHGVPKNISIDSFLPIYV